jgi:transcriptional regulator with XRE-family HTH domain
MLNLDIALAVVLKRKRHLSGFSQEELAFRCDVDRTYISLLERKKRKPTLSVLYKICDTLDIKLSDFVREVEELMDAAD